MPNNLYIKFNTRPSGIQTKKKHLRPQFISKIFFFLIPQANPDFDELIGDTAEWLLEIDLEDNLPIREIGIDQTGETLFIMPWRNNIGYWTDEEITLDYFKGHFKSIEINSIDFDKRWNAFAEKDNSNNTGK